MPPVYTTACVYPLVYSVCACVCVRVCVSCVYMSEFAVRVGVCVHAMSADSACVGVGVSPFSTFTDSCELVCTLLDLEVLVLMDFYFLDTLE